MSPENWEAYKRFRIAAYEHAINTNTNPNHVVRRPGFGITSEGMRSDYNKPFQPEYLQPGRSHDGTPQAYVRPIIGPDPYDPMTGAQPGRIIRG